MPIFLWELSLGLWLIVKGFKPATIIADAPLRPNSNVSAFVGDENNPCACAPRSGGAAVTGAQHEHRPRVHLEGPADACNQMRCGNGANGSQQGAGCRRCALPPEGRSDQPHRRRHRRGRECPPYCVASRRVSLSQDQAEYVEAAGAVITCVALRTVESIVVRTPAYPCG